MASQSAPERLSKRLLPSWLLSSCLAGSGKCRHIQLKRFRKQTFSLKGFGRYLSMAQSQSQNHSRKIEPRAKCGEERRDRESPPVCFLWSRPWCIWGLPDERQRGQRCSRAKLAQLRRLSARDPSRTRRVGSGTSICLDRAMRTPTETVLEFLRTWVLCVEETKVINSSTNSTSTIEESEASSSPVNLKGQMIKSHLRRFQRWFH